MPDLAYLTLGLDEGKLGEAIIVFLGLLAYLVPSILKRLQGKGEEESSEEVVRPGRRRKRSPRGGGEFLGGPPKQAAPKERKARDLWRELLTGEDQPEPRRPATPSRPGAPPVARRPQPTAQPVEEQPPVLTDLGHSLEELHETLERRHQELEEAHAGLPSESTRAPLVSSSLTGLPSEDRLEEIGGDLASTGTSLAQRLTVAPPTVRAARGHRRAWRRAVIASEVLAPPVALRDRTQQPGRLPG